MRLPRRRKLTVMVSSTVYGIEDLLNQIFATLEGYGYTVWMSHKGTIPVSSKRTAFGNCLEAVDRCDAFPGIITGRYGSGVGLNRKSITHREMVRAIRSNKLRWFLVHHEVTVARQLLRQFRFNADGTARKLAFQPTSILDDLRVLEMYEQAIRQNRPLSQRTGNWVQPYSSSEDALRFIRTQFEDPNRMWELFKDRPVYEGRK